MSRELDDLIPLTAQHARRIVLLKHFTAGTLSRAAGTFN